MKITECISSINALRRAIRQNLVEISLLNRCDRDETNCKNQRDIRDLTIQINKLMNRSLTVEFREGNLYEKLILLKTCVKTLHFLGRTAEIKFLMPELEACAFDLYIKILNNKKRLTITLGEGEFDVLDVLRFEKDILKLCIRYNCYSLKIAQTVYAEDEFKNHLRDIELLITKTYTVITSRISKVCTEMIQKPSS